MRSFEGGVILPSTKWSAPQGLGLVASRDFGPTELFWKTTLNQ
jgi:hypothetical protein